MGWIILVAALLVIVAAISVVISYIGREPFKHLLLKNKTPMNMGRIIGQRGTVVTPTSDVTGQVEVLGELWEARTESSGGIGKGLQVEVIDCRGTCLIVSRT